MEFLLPRKWIFGAFLLPYAQGRIKVVLSPGSSKNIRLFSLHPILQICCEILFPVFFFFHEKYFAESSWLLIFRQPLSDISIFNEIYFQNSN